VNVLLDAARRLPEIPVRLAGDGPMLEAHKAAAPDNASFLDACRREAVVDAYRAARFLVVPSVCFEGCPLVVAEAMGVGLPS